MNKKRFNKHFDEIGRRSRVKMHKSGKNWVRTVLSQISLLRVIRGKGQAKVTLPIIETNEELRSSRLAYLQALLASGAAISGTTLALNTFAEEQVAVVEQQVDSTDTLVDKNIVVVENVLTEVVSEESVASDTGSATASEAGSVSASTSGSFSASQSASVSLSSSESASLSVSVSASTSASVSVSTSASESASTSVSMSVSSSLVEGKTSSIGAVGSENSSEPSGSKVSESSLVAVESRGALSYAPSTDLLAPTDALAQPDSTIVAMATASSEVATGLVATSLNSSSSSQSETAQMANSLDYTNLDNAIASLQHALSYPEVDATTTTASRYKRYETALKVAKAALEESLTLREDSSASQDKVDTMALIAGQAAISLTGRISQIQAAGGKFAIAEGSGTRAVTEGAAGTDVSSSGVINFRTATASNEFKAGALSTGSLTSYVSRVFYDYNADSNVLTYTITLQPKANGKIGIGIGIDSSSTFGQVTVTGASLESQLTNRVLNPGPTPKGNYYYLSNVVANRTVTFRLTVQTNGSGVNNIRLKTANINTTNNSDLGLVASNVNDPYYFINPDQRLITATNNNKVVAAFVSGGSQTIYSKIEDAPIITDGLTDKSTSITGTGTPYSTVTLTFSNGAKTTAVVQANGTWTATPPPGAMAASTTVSAVQDTGKVFPAKDDGILNDVLNSQENRISAATVATIRDTTRPVVTYPNQVYFFYNTPLSKDLVLATVTEVSNSDTWQRWGISRADDTGTLDNDGNLNSMLIDANGSPVSLGIRQVAGTTNQWEIYMPKGSMIAPQHFNGSNLSASEQDFFTRWPFVVDAAGNRNILGNSAGMRLTAVAVPSGYINKAFGQTATSTEITNVVQSWTSSGRFFDGTSPAKSLTYVVQDTPPPTNVTKTVPVLVTTGEGLSTTATVLVNYPPSFSNVAQNVYVFSGEPTKVDKKVATITETTGQTFTTQTTNAAGLTVNTSGVISTGQTFTGAVGSQTVTLRATDNYNNSNSTTFVVRSYNVTGGQPMTAEVGTKVTTEAILNHVKATATGGGTAGLAGSGLDNLSSYSIVSGYDHEPTVGTKTVRVRVTLTDGNYKDVDVQINYRDTTAPTITEPRTIYVFKDTQMTQSLQLAKMSDAGTGINTTTSGTNNLQGLNLAKNSTDGNKNVTLMVSGTTSANVGQYTQVLTANDQGQPMSTTNNQAVLQVISAANSTIQRANHTPITWDEIKAKVATTLTGNHTGAGLSYKLLVNGNPVNDANVTAANIPTVDGSVTVRLTTDYNGVDDGGVYKDVVVTLDYPERVAPVVDITANNVFVFKDEPVKVANANFTQLDGAAGTRLQIGTATDQTGVGTVAIVDATSGAEANRGLTVSTDGANTSKTIYISGTPTAEKNLYTSKVKAADTLGTSGSSQENLSLYILEVPSEITLATREVTGAKYTNDEIAQAAIDAVLAGNDIQKAAANLTAKVIANESHPQDLYRPNHTITVRVMTASGTYKDVRVNVKYEDTTAPTATLTATSLYAFEGQALRAPIQLATLADAPNGSGLTGGQATTQIVMASSTTENGKGLTINTSGQVSGTPVASSQGTYTNRVLVRDNAGNTGYSNHFKMYILRVNPVTATREYTGTNKFTQDEITNLIKNKIAADSRISVTDLSALTYTIPDHTYAVGSQTIQATVRTPAGDTKTVNVTLTYTDTTNPTITNRKDVTVFIGKPIEMVGSNTLIPVTATDVSGVRYSLNNAGFGVTVDSRTGQLQGTATGSPGYNTRTVTVTDGQGRTTTSENFKIYLIEATTTTVTREYGQTISADEIKNAITLNRGTNGSPVTVNMELLNAIPQNANGTVRVRLTTSEGVTTVVDVPVVYTNERPTIQASNQTITKNREGTSTMYDVTTGVTVRDREDDRSASDSLVTRKRYEIVNANNVVVKTVAEGAATNIDIRDLPAGNYTVKIYATDSGATNPVEGSYILTVNA
ncbi:accessory Sec-dependent serine-rich glycoprotein adhesin, partial [Streptococcus suis]|uniref:accessory Sec-dependent serine-rich glycoprotein adhesin n=1 Tax=Streptococcus suis TaxID=1307 RepID=UPI002412C14E